MAPPTVALRSGDRMPALAFGTGTAWFNRAPGDLDAPADPKLQRSIVDALRAGVRHLDCAEMCVAALVPSCAQRTR